MAEHADQYHAEDDEVDAELHVELEIVDDSDHSDVPDEQGFSNAVDNYGQDAGLEDEDGREEGEQNSELDVFTAENEIAYEDDHVEGQDDADNLGNDFASDKGRARRN